MPKLCSFGCAPSGVPMHCFPNAEKFPERLKAWVNLVGGKLETAVDYAYYQRKLVCDIHFTARDRNRNNRLNALAVPSLHLHGTSAREPDISLISQPSDLHATNTGSSDHETSIKVPKSELISDLPSTSYKLLIGLPDYKTTTHVSPMTETILDFPSPISKETFTFSGALDITSAKTSPILKSKNKSFRNEPSASRQTETESKYHQPIPHIVNQLQTARKRVKQLQSEVIRLRKRNKVVTTKLTNAKNNSKHNCLQKITQNMTAAAKSFIHMQFTQTQKRSGGRRFTLEGQQLCHSIYKCSPQCYGLLSKVFTLPSAKTLKRFMRKQELDIQPGVSNGLNEGPMQLDTF